MAQARFKRISVVGLGYIGLPTAAMFASRQVEVIGVDVNQQVVDSINRGEIHIVEPGLAEVVRNVVTGGYLAAAVDPAPADAFLIAVPTPVEGDEHAPDLSFIKAAAMAIAPVLESGNLVVLESTSPVGTTEALATWLADARPDLSFPQDAGSASDVRVAYCPERVLPGRVMQELVSNDRVIGGMTEACSLSAIELYQIFVSGECVIASGPRVAEMTKLTENSYRDANIAFANELSIICDNLRINVWELIALANRHPRVNVLRPGPGVGGHCIAVDPWFIVSSDRERSALIQTARAINNNKPVWVAELIRQRICEMNRVKPTVALFGGAFKPNIDDLRHSPAIAVMNLLSDVRNAEFILVEPHITRIPINLSLNVRLADISEALDADLLVMLVAHDEFVCLDLDDVKDRVLDLVGIIGPF